MRILLIEDDHLLANTMLGMLRDEQNTVDWLDDGQQALNALLNDSFDLAILDLTLPRVDGLDIVKKVRSQGIETPVIILTARGDLDEKLQGLNAGADD
ncbi:MAG TPA: DNA-binding response regulator, partial [Marinobacter adhaerens]|nr:DNA-binding response regulator [Marinobacter adhaerens]